MIALHGLHKLISKSLFRRAIALVQFVVMVMLAVPVCCYEIGPEQGKSNVSLSAAAFDTNHDACPCCPDEQEAADDDCSTCRYCSFYTPLTSGLSLAYAPSEAQLHFHEPLTKLLEVHIPIFVPPQNLA
jgi:hypothetical protein